MEGEDEAVRDGGGVGLGGIEEVPAGLGVDGEGLVARGEGWSGGLGAALGGGQRRGQGEGEGEDVLPAHVDGFCLGLWE